MCESNPEHTTFVAKSSGKYYVEAHHLIPVSEEGSFEHSIDVPANILCLCPTCHRKFQHAIDLEKIELIERFYKLRKNGCNPFLS
jgi:5-methylcytosine-specific restriction protein A